MQSTIVWLLKFRRLSTSHQTPCLKDRGLFLTPKSRNNRTGNKWFNQPPSDVSERPTRKGVHRLILCTGLWPSCRSVHVSCISVPETLQERRNCFSHKRVPLLTGLTETNICMYYSIFVNRQRFTPDAQAQERKASFLPIAKARGIQRPTFDEASHDSTHAGLLSVWHCA